MRRLFLFLFLIACASTVGAIGIGPPRVELNFVAGLEHEFYISVVNNIDKPITAEFYVKGDLAQYITLEKQSAKLAPNENVRVKVTLKLPPDLVLSPGLHDNRIGARELPADRPPGMVAAVAAVEAQLWIYSSLEGQVLEIADFEATNVRVNETVTFTLRVRNIGTEDVNASATIKILDQNSNTVNTVSLRDAIKKGQEAYLKANWIANVPPGLYHAFAEVRWPNGFKTAQAEFGVGSDDIEIIEIKAAPVRRGQQAQIQVTLGSLSNEIISDVWVEAKIQEGKTVLATAESTHVDVRAWSSPTLNLFIDTAGIQAKDYEGVVILHYLNKTKEQNFKLVVKGNEALRITILIILILLVLYVLWWFIWGRKRETQ